MFAAAALMLLSAQAQSLTDGKNFNASVPQPDLVFHTAPPGLMLTPRSDAEVMAYDLTIIPREGMAFVRWGKLDDNGESAGLWTKWRDYDNVISFNTPGTYVLETHAEAIGKENSATLKATFRVGYVGMTSAPGIKIMPSGQREYYVTLTSLYGDDIYYRYRDYYNGGVWYKWRLYTEELPFTSGGTYVLEVNCNDDPLAVFIEVPNVDYFKTGDVNHNGSVDMEDLTALISMLLNTELRIGTGDVNKDGVITIGDVTTLIGMLLNNR